MNLKLVIIFLVWLILTVIFEMINNKFRKKQIANSKNPEYDKREQIYIGGSRVDISLCMIAAGLITTLIFLFINKIIE